MVVTFTPLLETGREIRPGSVKRDLVAFLEHKPEVSSSEGRGRKCVRTERPRSSSQVSSPLFDFNVCARLNSEAFASNDLNLLRSGLYVPSISSESTSSRFFLKYLGGSRLKTVACPLPVGLSLGRPADPMRLVSPPSSRLVFIEERLNN